MSSSFGAQSTWRQLVDLIGRGRVSGNASANDAAIARLRMIRGDVPPPIRAASARALAFAMPPVDLVAVFAEDEIAVAAPVLRAVQLSGAEWRSLLPRLSPAARSILRHRRDLSPDVERALETFGSVDFVLGAPSADAVPPVMPRAAADPKPVAIAAAEALLITAPEPVVAIDWTEIVGDAVVAESAVNVAPATEQGPIAPNAPLVIDWTDLVGDAVMPEPCVAPAAVGDAAPAPAVDLPETIAPVSPFVSIADVATGLPVVAEALRQAERPVPVPVPAAALPSIAPLSAGNRQRADGTFQISELVARIDAFQRQREQAPTAAPTLEIQPELFAREPTQAETFRFETDANGIVRWIEGAARAPLIGLSLDLAPRPGGSRVDGVAAGAFRRRAGFANARLLVEGRSDAAGQWRITGIPVFDRASGRFTGYRGTARRPRPDETAEPARETRNPAADALRQLVHELRTPTNAIAGFAEMIESQMLGPVPAPYRAHAAAIRGQASGLLTAIDDIDMAARIETHALDLRPGDVPVAPLLDRILADLAPLATLRGAVLDRYVSDDALAILGDDRAVERLMARLMATLVASGSAGERIGVAATGEEGTVVIVFDRPAALAAYAEETLLTIDAEAEAERDGAPLLGTGFALRLARNLAAELRGSLTIGDKALTLRLPAAFSATMEQAFSN